MSHSVILLNAYAFFIALSSAPILAKEAQATVAEKMPPRAEEFLKSHDQDRDQKISKVEFERGKRVMRLSPEARTKIFNRLDKNKDGFLSRGELSPNSPKKKERLLARADLDRDGRISQLEFAQHIPFSKMTLERREKIFGRLDVNLDGFLDRKDTRLGKGMAQRGEEKRLPKMRVQEGDLDQSGALSWSEFQKLPQLESYSVEQKHRLFHRLDRDENTELNSRELRASAGRAKARKREKKEAKK